MSVRRCVCHTFAYGPYRSNLCRVYGLFSCFPFSFLPTFSPSSFPFSFIPNPFPFYLFPRFFSLLSFFSELYSFHSSIPLLTRPLIQLLIHSSIHPLIHLTCDASFSSVSTATVRFCISSIRPFLRGTSNGYEFL